MAQWIEQFIRQGGYWALAVITFVENIFPPIPSEVILPLGGYLVTQGRLTLWGVVLAGTIGSLVGAFVLYYVGRKLKRRRIAAWAAKHGHWVLLTRGDVEDAFDWFERHGGAAVFFCRMVPGVRSLISVPAGSSGMSLGKFTLYSVAGTAIWTTALALVGMWLGGQYRDAEAFLSWINYIIVGMIVLTVAGWLYKRRREQKGSAEESGRDLPQTQFDA
jgi:membrane protein DedA with SNARE-associated domain